MILVDWNQIDVLVGYIGENKAGHVICVAVATDPLMPVTENLKPSAKLRTLIFQCG
jgi:hypothetical protein